VQRFLAEARHSRAHVRAHTQFVIKVFLPDGTSTTVCVRSNETAFEVCRKMVVKNRFVDDPTWCAAPCRVAAAARSLTPRPCVRTLVEVCPELLLERVLEDHEPVGDIYNAWPPTCDYRFDLRLHPDKYSIFTHSEVRLPRRAAPRRPPARSHSSEPLRPAQRYFPASFKADLEEVKVASEVTGKAKRILLQVHPTGAAPPPPFCHQAKNSTASLRSHGAVCVCVSVLGSFTCRSILAQQRGFPTSRDGCSAAMGSRSGRSASACSAPPGSTPAPAVNRRCVGALVGPAFVGAAGDSARHGLVAGLGRPGCLD
jgi:hypothetical protein